MLEDCESKKRPYLFWRRGRWIRRHWRRWIYFGGRRWAWRRRRRGSSTEGGVYYSAQFLLIERRERDLDTIDKEKRCPVDSNRSAAVLIQFDPCFNLFGIHVSSEALDIQSKLGGVLFEDGANVRG